MVLYMSGVGSEADFNGEGNLATASLRMFPTKPIISYFYNDLPQLPEALGTAVGQYSLSFNGDTRA